MSDTCSTVAVKELETKALVTTEHTFEKGRRNEHQMSILFLAAFRVQRKHPDNFTRGIGLNHWLTQAAPGLQVQKVKTNKA